MRETTRRFLLRAGALAVVAVVVGLVVLRAGRPLFYTDGERQIMARELGDASMLVWDAPAVESELPGPVRGRVQTVSDGRLLFGLANGDERTDLVLWDPQFPNEAPEPVFALNSTGHDLAPALGPDGYVYFASDRGGGRGGFDLYRSRWARGAFGPVRRLPDTINTGLDETDPAPDPRGISMVFVRRDPTLDEGRNATLMITDAAAQAEPVVLQTSSEVQGVLHRDPAFSPDGVSLWFVRQESGGEPTLLRMWRHGDVFAAPVVQRDLMAQGVVRAPEPLRNGFAVRVLRSEGGGAPLTYVANAREVYPWWAGQALLELILFGLLIALLVLELLLLLGRRWRQLDFVTWCILASLLVHLLLLLWMTNVELVRRFVAPGPQEGMLEVQLLSADGSDQGEGAEAGQALLDPSQELQFAGHARALTAAAPGSGVVAAEVRVEAEAGQRQAEVAPAAEVTEVASSVQDVASAQATRTGTDAASEPSDRDVAAPQVAASAPQAARAARASSSITVQTPGSDAAPTAPSAQAVTVPAVAANLAMPQAELDAPVSPSVEDDVEAPAVRVATGESAASEIPAQARSLPLAAQPTELANPERADAPAPRVAQARVAAPAASSLLESTAAARRVPVPDARRLASSPQPRSLTRARSLRDAPAVARPVVAAGGADAAPAQPLALRTPTAESTTAPTPERRSRTGPSAAASGAPARPQTELDARADRDLRTARASRTASAMRPTRSFGAPRPALRDRSTPGAAPPQPRVADQGGSRATPQPLAVAALTPSAAAVSRPVRERRATRSGAPHQGIQVPGSLLDRAPWRSSPRPTVPTPAVVASVFANRVGPAKAQALERYGGTEETERAVRRGLGYLAGIQRRNGSWGSRERSDEKYGETIVGKTGLCVLAFLGAGHTPTSNTEHSDVVARAIEFLIGEQDEDTGHFGHTSSYSHGISTYALAECYGMVEDADLRRRLGEPVQLAIEWIIANQNRRRDPRSHGGWGYFSPSIDPEDRFARSSVTAWMVMALESAKLSGLEVPARSLTRARTFLLQCWDRDRGYFLYNREPGRLRSDWRTLPASTPAALFALQLLGESVDDHKMRAGFEYVLERRPRDYRRYNSDDFVLRGAGNVYFWYYGSLATFLAGGELWNDWNEALKRVLPAGQAEDGSWPSIGPYARYAGDTRRDKSYSTAMCVLSLEVYYRYFTPLLRGK